MKETAVNNKILKIAFEQSGNIMVLTGTPECDELPVITAKITPSACERGCYYVVVIDITNDKTLFDGICFRGKNFAKKIARGIIKGSYSYIGKHRRATANKQKGEL